MHCVEAVFRCTVARTSKLLFFSFQCESMVRAAYDSPWYEASEGFKRSIRIMVVRSMKPFRLTGGKLYVMSLDTFVVVRCLLPYTNVLQ